MMLMLMQLVMFLLLTVYISFVPKFVPEGFGVYVMVSMTYENLVPLVPRTGTKDKPTAVRFRGELLTLVPKKIILITN